MYKGILADTTLVGYDVEWNPDARTTAAWGKV